MSPRWAPRLARPPTVARDERVRAGQTGGRGGFEPPDPFGTLAFKLQRIIAVRSVSAGQTYSAVRTRPAERGRVVVTVVVSQAGRSVPFLVVLAASWTGADEERLQDSHLSFKIKDRGGSVGGSVASMADKSLSEQAREAVLKAIIKAAPNVGNSPAGIRDLAEAFALLERELVPVAGAVRNKT